jgi:2-polyprenyl-3-methyl-5-hydroxy-6-metoxy-1,4-benzoquinol methylase
MVQKKDFYMVNRCPFCKKESQLFFQARDYNRRITKEEFNYYRCTSCGLIYLFPVPTDLGKYYPNEYYALPSSVEQLASNAESERFKIDIIQRFVSHGRLLEIGPSWGGFTYLAQKAGFEVEAIEMDTRCCKFLTDIVGIRAINDSDVVKAIKKTDSYDVIAMWHVIEHLSDPWATLNVVVEKLLPGGILAIASPNPDSFQFRMFKSFWPHVDAPRHIELIPARLLSERMRELGLRRLLNTTKDEGSLVLNANFYCSLGKFSDVRFIKIGLHLMGKIMGEILAPIEKKEGLGCGYTIIFQKEKNRSK